MCGIAGYIGKPNISEEKILGTLSLMYNRGPDFQNYFLIKNDTMNIALLHSRLSIIDIDSRSNQPFKQKHATLIFNGEIYNYVELRNELKKMDIYLSTQSDTEVLLNYYLLYGEQCVDYFEGMWAFAIYDEKEKKLFLSRDRFAEKPLYFFDLPDGFYFASETRFLESLSGVPLSINYQHLYRYLVNGHKSLYKTNERYFTGVSELPFANNLSLDFSFKKNIYSYWNPDFSVQKMSENEAVEGVRHHLKESLKIRLRSDVPLCFNLSGGIDSSALVSMAAKEFNNEVVTFSIIDKDERYNEKKNIQATIDDIHCKNIQIKLSPENNYIEKLKSIIAYHNAPVATISYLVHSLLSEQIHKHGYKVAFSGTGADEIFTGYYEHFNLHLYEMRNHPNFSVLLDEWKKYVSKLVRNPELKNPQMYFDNPSKREHIYLNNKIFASYLKVNFHEEFSEKQFHSSFLRNRMLNELFYEVTRVILNEDDLNSMQYSIENRSPYLDSRLLSFAYSIPTEFLIQKGLAKYILRKAMKGILNDEVRLDREKKGFNASINSIIDFNNPEHIDYLLSDSPVFDIVDKNKIEKLMKQKEFTNSFKKFLFNFINVKIFLER
ncbi:MAG: asparagine synthase (glutamine-hydrolyzing) [Bacteroidota bacterium]